MTLHMGLRRKVSPAALLGYAGGLVGREHLADEVISRPPVMLLNGELDELAPVYGMHVAVKALSEAGIIVAGQVMPNLGHAVNADALIFGGRFLLSAFAYLQKHGVNGVND